MNERVQMTMRTGCAKKHAILCVRRWTDECSSRYSNTADRDGFTGDRTITPRNYMYVTGIHTTTGILIIIQVLSSGHIHLNKASKQT